MNRMSVESRSVGEDGIPLAIIGSESPIRAQGSIWIIERPEEPFDAMDLFGPLGNVITSAVQLRW